MIVVVTGMVGVDKKSYLVEVLNRCAQNKKNVTICNVGNMMYEQSPDIPKGRILDISLKRLESIRRGVFREIIAKSKTAEHMIINTHATFRWRHGLFPAIDFDHMRELNADMYICMIDSTDALHVRLEEEQNIGHSLKDILVWREEEILGTEMMARGISDSVPIYCLARGYREPTSETFYRLMFENNRKKVYLSYPMTHVTTFPEVKEKILDFCGKMKKHFICFDPGDLEESYLPYYAEDAKNKGKDTVEVEALGKMVTFSLDEIFNIKDDIDQQIYARDFALIDQADMIISYIPALPDGMPSISSGVERELQHAYEAAKDVYVIWTAKARPSVFVTQTATKVFTTVEEADNYFIEKGLTKT